MRARDFLAICGMVLFAIVLVCQMLERSYVLPPLAGLMLVDEMIREVSDDVGR